MDYTVSAVFKGDSAHLNQLDKFLQSAMSGGNPAKVLYDAFTVALVSVSNGSEGLLVVFNCDSSGRTFCTWACKQCELSVEYTETNASGTQSYAYPESVPSITKTQESAIKAMRLEKERTKEDVEEPPIFTGAERGSQDASTRQSASDAALQTLLNAAKADGIAEGRFQILKNIMKSCDTLSELLELTGVEQEEFMYLFNRFSEKGR